MRLEHCNHFIWSGLLLCMLVGCSQEKETPKIKAVPVTVEKARLQDVPLFVETIGNISSPHVVHVRPEVSGTLLETHMLQGQFVKKGDLLYTIDSKPYKAALDQAKANLIKDKAERDFAKKKVKRYQDLVKREFISQLAFDEYQRDAETTEAQVKKDRAEVALAEINLDHCKITSPIDGRISEFHIYPGNLVCPDDKQALTVIRQFSPINVHFNVPQRDLQEIQRYQRGEKLTMQVFLPHESEDTDAIYQGHVYFIDNHINQNTGTILLKGQVENQDHLLWPGEFVRVRLIVREKEQALILPDTAVHYGQEGPFVFVVEADQTVSIRRVMLAEKLSDRLIVSEGIKEGEQVVIKGHHHLYQGRKVVIKNESI